MIGTRQLPRRSDTNHSAGWDGYEEGLNVWPQMDASNPLVRPHDAWRLTQAQAYSRFFQDGDDDGFLEYIGFPGLQAAKWIGKTEKGTGGWYEPCAHCAD